MTRRHDSKISAIFWGIILVFPFVFLLLSFIAYFAPFSDSSVSVSFDSFSTWFSSFCTSYANFPFIVTQPLFEFLSFLASDTGDLSISAYFFVSYIIGLLSYYVFIHLMRIVIDVLLFIPHLFHSWISKFDRKVE